MKRRLFIILTVILSLITTSQVFGASKWSKTEVVNESYNSFWPTASYDNKTIAALDLSTVISDSAYDIKIKVYHNIKGKWLKPVTVASNGVKQNIPLFETHPKLSGNGKTLVYMGYDSAKSEYRLYEVQKNKKGAWGKALIIEAVPAGWFGSSNISLNYDGTVMAYTCGDGGFFGGTSTLYTCVKSDGKWQASVKVPTGDYFGGASYPCLSKDGKSLAWAQANSNNDILFSSCSESGWAEPTVISSTSNNEDQVTLSGDGKTVFFWRQYVKDSVITGRDLYSVKISDGAWGKPVKLNSKREVSTLVYDSPVSTDYSGKQAVYTHFAQTGDVINKGVLAYSEYIKGAWTAPKEITKFEGSYHLFPLCSEDGSNIAYIDYSLKVLR